MPLLKPGKSAQAKKRSHGPSAVMINKKMAKVSAEIQRVALEQEELDFDNQISEIVAELLTAGET